MLWENLDILNWISCFNYCLQAEKYIEFDHSFTDEEKVQANALRISCNLNNAACKLKLGEYLEASKQCTKVPLSQYEYTFIYHMLDAI